MNAEATQGSGAGRRHSKPARPPGRFYPPALPDRGGELCTELTAEVRSPGVAVHAREREHAAGARAG
jgi:hypothetical protein